MIFTFKVPSEVKKALVYTFGFYFVSVYSIHYISPNNYSGFIILFPIKNTVFPIYFLIKILFCFFKYTELIHHLT